MMRTSFGKRCAVRAACLIVGIICTVLPLRAQAAEENGMPQPSSAKIYSSMSDSSDIIANLIVGNGFEVVGAENDSDGGIWYRVRADFGVEGYVKAGELDKLILDAQAMQPPVAAPENVNVGEESSPEGDDNGDEPTPEGDNAGEESTPTGDDSGEEPSPADDNAEEEPTPDNNDAGVEAVPEGDNANGEVAPEGSDALGESNGTAAPELEYGNDGEESFSGEAAAPADGAGFGEAADDQTEENAIIGNEGFTIIERTDQTKVHRHGRIDAVLIMIVAGGVLCIMAIAVLVKRVWTCLGTEG